MTENESKRERERKSEDVFNDKIEIVSHECQIATNEESWGCPTESVVHN